MKNVLKSESLVVLPKRHETSAVAIGNVNWAAVGQSNASLQVRVVGVAAAQLSGQSNTAVVLQHN